MTAPPRLTQHPGRRTLRTAALLVTAALAVSTGSPATAWAADSPTATAPATSAPTASTAPTATMTPTATTTPTATATQATPSGSPTPSTSTTPDPDAEPADVPLTPEQVAAQLAQAAALRAQIAATDASLAVATEALQQVSAQLAQALEQVATAQQEEKAALTDRARQTAVLARLRQDLMTSEEDLGRWARTAYTVGGSMASYEAWLLALGGVSTSEVGHDLALLAQVGVDGSKQVKRLEAAATLQKVATRQAQLAAAKAQAARLRADAAARSAQRLLARQKVALAELQLEQARLLGTDTMTEQQRSRLAAAEALIAAAGGGLAVGSCTGLSTVGYANGTIPVAALCPLWGAPAHQVRADAAAGFERMAKAYAAQFGTPLCVTDSYRTLAGQVSVFARKPALAAKPGSSNHGWGTALDLCGGIESFGTVQHAWMLSHAPLYGWFHPAWAGPAGSRPEPWHWEFAG